MEKLAEKISDSELEVMRVLWEAEAPLPISEIRLALQQRKGWEPTTTKTLVQRLCSKQALAQEKRKWKKREERLATDGKTCRKDQRRRAGGHAGAVGGGGAAAHQ